MSEHPHRIDPDDSHPDITDRIDALTEDAATWNPAGDHTRPPWATPARAGAMTAIQLDMVGPTPIAISDAEPGRDISRRVRDPAVDRIIALRTLQFWIGDNSATTSPVNPGATGFLHRLLGDVRDGGYIASDHERNHTRALLQAPDNLPTIHGTCLITGIGDDGAAAPLDENFQSWFTRIREEAEQRRQSRIAALAREIGIPPEMISHITVIPIR